MKKTLTDQEIRDQLQKLDHSELQGYLIQVLRKLGEYSAEELSQEEKIFFEEYEKLQKGFKKIQTEKEVLEQKLKQITEELNEAIKIPN